MKVSLRIYIKILKIHRTEAVWQQILGEITSLQHHWWTEPGARRMFPSHLAVTPQHVAYVLFLKTNVMLLFKTGYCRCSGSPQSARKTADGPSLPQSWNAVEGQNPYLEVSQKNLFLSQNYVLWNKKRKKHIWECLLSQRRHVVVGKLLFRNSSCCVIMILGPFPFPSISCTSTATCWLRTCTPCGDTLAPGWIAHDSVILTLFSSIWKFGTKHWQLLRIRCRTSVRECETVWSNQLQTGIQTVCELKHPTVSKLEQLEASQCQWSWI